MTKHKRELQDLFQRCGWLIESLVTKDHIHVVASRNGVRRKFISSKTPSDIRSAKNLEALLRRTARELQ